MENPLIEKLGHFNKAPDPQIQISLVSLSLLGQSFEDRVSLTIAGTVTITQRMSYQNSTHLTNKVKIIADNKHYSITVLVFR